MDALHLVLALAVFVAVGFAWRERKQRKKAEEMPAVGGSGATGERESTDGENGHGDR